MAIFKRKHRNLEDDLLLAGGAEVERPEAQLPKGVGGLLRRTREGYGRSIADVASVLRIRPEYLEALEHNSVDGLPGPTYATGFVRAYAEYLGLDGVEMVRRFKQEKAGLDTPQALSFPIPADERGMPGSAMFLTALILAGLGYATYYYMSSGDRTRPPQVEAVPAKLLPPVAATPDAPSSLAETAKPAESDKAEPALGQSAAAPLVPPPPVTTLPVTTSPGTPPAVIGTPLTPLSSTATPQPAAPSQAAVPVVAAGPARPTPPARPGELPAVPAPAAVDGVPPSGDAPRVYGNAAGPSRITLRAIADSWVQVRDTDQSLLLTRVLKAGDSYVVPDKPGLSMRTGNAGALAVMVDGKPAPSIGALGVVRKNIALDPVKLSEGTASGE